MLHAVALIYYFLICKIAITYSFALVVIKSLYIKAFFFLKYVVVFGWKLVEKFK